MASFYIKLGALFFIIVALFDSNDGALNFKDLGKIFDGTVHKKDLTAPKTPINWPNTAPKTPINRHKSKSNDKHIDANVFNKYKMYKAKHNAKDKAKEFGEKLAAKYFGPGGKKGFRWGYKEGKRIHAAARKCDDFMQTLSSSCPYQPLQDSPLLNSTVVRCIVEVTNFGTCLLTENNHYPPEANCTLDHVQNIDPVYCGEKA